ncbi:MAG TPA: hypothetical protein VKB86_12215 [Pyrinomonadaceae bacterium]|nr:hypothetical protein [Pyrinomonadaceae bacterium]
MMQTLLSAGIHACKIAEQSKCSRPSGRSCTQDACAQERFTPLKRKQSGFGRQSTSRVEIEKRMKDCVRGNLEQKHRLLMALGLCATLLLSSFSFAQQSNSVTSASASNSTRDYPKEIRGYKVEIANVEVKGSAKSDKKSSSDEANTEALIQLGEPHVKSLSPLGITLEVPVRVAAVKQGGRVDFLTFEDMTVNGTPVTVSEYDHPFDLPNDSAVTLSEPITIYISTPRAMLGAIGEWREPKSVWPVTGRVYVFGHFKKFLFTFKRVVPVELNLLFKNPLSK